MRVKGVKKRLSIIPAMSCEKETVMDSQALKTFRRKIVNPLHWRKANRVLQKYTKTDLSNLDRAKNFINELAMDLAITLSPDECTAAAKWIVSQEIDPGSRKGRLGIWRKVK
jgi:hypothetical protein